MNLIGADDTTPSDAGPRGWQPWMLGILTMAVLTMLFGFGWGLQAQVNAVILDLKQHDKQPYHQVAGERLEILQGVVEKNTRAVEELVKVQVRQTAILERIERKQK